MNRYSIVFLTSENKKVYSDKVLASSRSDSVNKTITKALKKNIILNVQELWIQSQIIE